MHAHTCTCLIHAHYVHAHTPDHINARAHTHPCAHSPYTHTPHTHMHTPHHISARAHTPDTHTYTQRTEMDTFAPPHTLTARRTQTQCTRGLSPGSRLPRGGGVAAAAPSSRLILPFEKGTGKSPEVAVLSLPSPTFWGGPGTGSHLRQNGRALSSDSRSGPSLRSPQISGGKGGPDCVSHCCGGRVATAGWEF